MWNQRSSNKLCSETIIYKDYVQHIERLRKTRSATDCGPPKTFNILKRGNMKKKVLEMRKNIQIQQNNKILLQKMLNIDLKPSKLHPLVIAGKLPHSHGSLNRKVRINELNKITTENRALLNRIQSARPTYQNQKWDEHSQKHTYLKQNLSHNAWRAPRPQSANNQHMRDLYFTQRNSPYSQRTSSRRSFRNRPQTAEYQKQTAEEFQNQRPTSSAGQRQFL